MRIPKMIENGMLDYTEPERKPYFCPECGLECETIYQLRDGTICGCDNCVEALDAWEALDD